MAFEYDDAGRLVAIAAPCEFVDKVVADGYAFMTNGCAGPAGEPGCTRPMGSWRPSEPPRDYPWHPTGTDLDEIRAQLRLNELVRAGPGPARPRELCALPVAGRPRTDGGSRAV